ncbi:cardiolipin synthase [Peptococcaceae bacterium CEB3]|nr:cardiolipin synthase [Peptococcaceae bacterium CEB3]
MRCQHPANPSNGATAPFAEHFTELRWDQEKHIAQTSAKSGRRNKSSTIRAVPMACAHSAAENSGNRLNDAVSTAIIVLKSSIGTTKKREVKPGMRISFRWIAPLLGIFLLAGCSGATNANIAPSVPAATPPATSITQPSLLEGQAIFDRADNMIRSAQHSILLEMYELGDAREIALLEQKAESGIPVLAVLDGSERETAKAIPELEAHHVKVQIAVAPLIEKSGIQHAKMLVVDDSQVLIGGMNWGYGSVENADADVYTHGATAKEAQSVFESDWRKLGATIPAGVPLENTSAQDILSGRPLLKAILTELNHAQTIQAALFELSNRQIIGKLAERAKAGAKVQVLLDTRMEKEINSRAAKQLSNVGVQVKFYPGNQVLHAKMIVTDHVTIIGSANGSYDAFTRNHELDLLTRNPGVMKEAHADFEAMLARQ